MEDKEIRSEYNVIRSAFGLARALKRRPPEMHHDIPPAAERALTVIAKNDGLSSGELCEILDVRPSSVSELADKMAARGKIEVFDGYIIAKNINDMKRMVDSYYAVQNAKRKTQ